MRVLLTNDDGIRAEGLRAMYRALREAGHTVHVVAPMHEQSGVGHSLTFFDPLRAHKIEEPDFEGLGLYGTPTDCVKLALGNLLKKRPDMVISGINAGSNVGPDILYSGTVGAATEAAVRAYQRFAGLTVDGIVGRKTWDSLYGKASALRSSGPVVTLKRLPYPGTPLTIGSDSSAVLYYALLLQRIAYYYDSVASPALSSQYTQETADATASAQELLGLPATGAADAETWTAVEALSLQLAAFTPNPDRHPEQGPDYPGRAMKEGSVGPDVSLIEGWVNDRSQLYCEEDYVTDNASFGPEDTAAVKETQQRAGLETNGVVDRPTWAALRAQSHTACDSCTEEG